VPFYTDVGLLQRLHLAIHDRIWSVLGRSHEALVRITVGEVIHAAIDAGVGSEKAECCGEILVSIASISVRGLVIARLRKVSSQKVKLY
jgi:neurofibromin 1